MPSPSVDDLRERISARVLHQPTVVETVAKVLAARLGVAKLHPEYPYASFLATGLTGTGKSTLAGAIAEAVYGNAKRVIRIDGSELPSIASVNTLLGAQPGYTGYDDTDTLLTTRVNEEPESVVLIDEIEKAHPAIWRLLLQVNEGPSPTIAAALPTFHGPYCC